MRTMNLLSFLKGCQAQRQKFEPVYGTTSRKRAGVTGAAKLLVTLCAVAAGLLRAQAQSVTLAWNASTSVGVTGYRLYWGATSRSYASNTNAGNSTQATVLGLTLGSTNYFAVTAYNSSGLESAFSTEIAYTMPVT